jgi:hypothetical protein
VTSFRSAEFLARVVFAFGSIATTFSSAAIAQDAPDTQNAAPIVRASTQSQSPAATTTQEPAQPMPEALPPTPAYDKTIFQANLPASQLAFLKQFDGVRSKDLYHDKQFKFIKKAAFPGWEFHYGHDMSVSDAMDAALDSAKDAVQIRDGRYVMLSGTSELFPGLRGRGFIWIDMQDGIALGGFYFHPTNGEPTPTLTVFSKQLRVDTLSMSQLPPEFFKDYSQWCADERISPVTTRYFIGDLKKRILLEHDEDFCSSNVGPMGSDCLQMTADAADLDMNTAYYLEQVHYATNATAYMLVGSEQVAFVQMRDSRCGSVVDPLGCRIRVTREHIHGITRPRPMPRR